MYNAFLGSSLGVSADLFYLVLTVLVILVCVMSFFWCKKHGLGAGLAIGFIRLLWLVPMLSLLFFVEQRSSLNTEILDKTFTVFVDDSHSMTDSSSRRQEVRSVLELTEKLTKSKGYRLEKVMLSEVSGRTSKSDLNLFKDKIEFGSTGHPWMLVSDGGAADLEFGFSQSSSRVPAVSKPKSKGVVVGVGSEDFSNIWVESVEPLGFVFEQEGFSLRVTVGRTENAPNHSQVHVKSGHDFLGSATAHFATGETFVTVEVRVKQIARGTHQLVVQVPAYAKEKQVVDNKGSIVVESLTNTLGVLHLLGEPSWDGRFMRKFLKDEPKFDRISFFILRDPQDSVKAADDELSLIPFPAERLFTKELPNFKLLVIQNFDMQRFLRPVYQENLVKFVENGGSLVFMGGERALARGELLSGPLKNILPFSAKDVLAPIKTAASPTFSSGATYSAGEEFSVKLTQRQSGTEATEILHQGLKEILPVLSSTEGWQGLHKISNQAKLKHGGEVLLSAKTGSGQTPLLIANYPGKGRALWFLTDSSWRTAFAPTHKAGPHTYSRFMKTWMDWSLKSSSEERLSLSNAILVDDEGQTLSLTAELSGYQAVEIGRAGSKWKQNWSVCGVSLSEDKLQKKRISGGRYLLSALVDKGQVRADACLLKLRAVTPSSESVNVEFPVQRVSLQADSEVVGSSKVLRRIGLDTGSTVLLNFKKNKEHLQSWFEKNLDASAVSAGAPDKLEKKYFWFFDFEYAWLFFLGFPIEVLLRRRKEIGW